MSPNKPKPSSDQVPPSVVVSATSGKHTVISASNNPEPMSYEAATDDTQELEPLDAPLDSCREIRIAMPSEPVLEVPPTTPRSAHLIAPSSATVGAILDHARKPQSERLLVTARVAAGGMGTIDAAIDKALDRRIAVKTLHPFLRSDDQTVRMFLREARLTGLLDHPHIVPLYDLGEREDGQLVFTMKLVEGKTLGDLIDELPRSALDTTTIYTLLDVFLKVCDALAFAHSRGVIHCDVKPANVMVGDYGQVFLMDWGIARFIEPESPPTTTATQARLERGRRHSSLDNSILGTPGYMSPEQARGDRKHLDVRSDVFLLGALLYEMLTRRAPYENAERMELIARAVACDFPSPRAVAGDAAVPLELERIVLRAMSKDPSDRYPSVMQLKEDVVRFVRGGAEFTRQSFVPGEAIVREGDAGDAAFILVEGRCDIRKNTPSGMQTLHSIGPGAVFGEMAILTEGPRTATVVATEPTTVLVVTSRVLEEEMAALKPWMAALLRSLASRFRTSDSSTRSPRAGSTAVHIANSAFMHLETWGERDASGARETVWSTSVRTLETQLGVASSELVSVLMSYGFRIDTTRDRLSLSDPASLRVRLRGELGL
jgi:serine/threonine protein kinase